MTLEINKECMDIYGGIYLSSQYLAINQWVQTDSITIVSKVKVRFSASNKNATSRMLTSII